MRRLSEKKRSSEKRAGAGYGADARFSDRSSLDYKLSVIFGNHRECFGKYRRDDRDCRDCPDRDDCRKVTQEK